MIKCELFSKKIGSALASEFKDGDKQAIILADPEKIKTEMESNFSYYYNPSKVKMYKEMLEKGSFLIPLVSIRMEELHWVEGFHYVNAALELKLTAVPIGTSLSFAQQLKSLVGVNNPETEAVNFDFSECEATIVG